VRRRRSGHRHGGRNRSRRQGGAGRHVGQKPHAEGEHTMLSTITKVPTIRYERRGEKYSLGVDPCPDPAHAPVFRLFAQACRPDGSRQGTLSDARAAVPRATRGWAMTARGHHALVHSTDGPLGVVIGRRHMGSHLGNRSRSRAEAWRNGAWPSSSGWKAGPVCATRACPRASMPGQAC